MSWVPIWGVSIETPTGTIQCVDTLACLLVASALREHPHTRTPVLESCSHDCDIVGALREHPQNTRNFV